MFNNLKFAVKLILIGGSLILIPLLIMGIVSLRSSANGLRSSINDHMVTKSTSIAEHLNHVMNEEKKLILSLSISPDIIKSAEAFREKGLEQSQNEIQQAGDHLVHFVQTKNLGERSLELGLADVNGNVLVSSSNETKGINIKNRTYFKNALTGKVNIGEIEQNKADGHPVVPIATPVYNSSRQVIGVFYHVLNLDFLKDIVLKKSLSKNGYAVVFDKYGIVIVHPDKSQVMKLDINTIDGIKTVLKRIEQGESGVENYVFKGVPKTFGFSQVKSTKWGVVFTMTDDEYMAPINHLRYLMIGLTVIAMAISLIVFFMFSMSVAKNLRKGVDFAFQIANGNLDVKLDINQNDEVGELADALTDMAENLRLAISDINSVMGSVKKGDLSRSVQANLEGHFDHLKTSINGSIKMLNHTMLQVNTNSHQVKLGSRELAESSQSLAAGATEQAAGLEEISSAMSEIESKTKANDDNTSRARQLINEAQTAAENGNRVMHTLLTSIEQMKNTSANVSKIIKDVDEIAFQTNLLALNAAVEAARAGKYGKGFAVVADEVRNLAARSAEAAKNTNDMINHSISETENGVIKANETAVALDEIRESVIKAYDIIDEISASSNEQLSAVLEVNKGLTQVNQVVQSNSSIAEETASASEELAQQAVNMQNLMSQFNITQSDGTDYESMESIGHQVPDDELNI